MKKYFEKFSEMWKMFNGTKPKISFYPDCNSELYCGKKDENEYISWEPKEKNTITDLSKIEEKYKVKFHKDITEYFNSYWFLEIVGFYKTYYISLIPVIPSEETSDFEFRLQDYYESNGKLDYIPIELESNSFKIIAVENKSGEIFLINQETKNKNYLFPSIKDMINHIDFKK